MTDQPLVPISSTTRTLRIIGDARVLQILRSAFRGARRFSDWADDLAIPRPLLVDRLNRLVDSGIMAKVGYSSSERRFEYRLTAMGRDLWAYLLSLWAWEKQWVPLGVEALRSMRHRTCGTIAIPVACCGACEQSLTAADVVDVPGPGYRLEPRMMPKWQRRALVNDPHLGHPDFHHETTQVLGNRWSTMLAARAMAGVVRFQDLQADLGISPNLLTSRLRELTDMNILAKVQYQGSPARFEYVPTEKGRALYATRVFAVAWGDRWLADAAGPPYTLVHRTCGEAFTPTLRCSACSGVLRPGNFHFEPDVAFRGRRAQRAERAVSQG